MVNHLIILLGLFIILIDCLMVVFGASMVISKSLIKGYTCFMMVISDLQPVVFLN